MIIYKITNILNNKIYIGQHNGKRFSSYFGGGKLLKEEIKLIGIKNFKKEVIVEGEFNQDLLNCLEKHYIRLYASTFPNKGYNIQCGGKGHDATSVTDEFREKTRKRMIGNKIMLGRKRTQESKDKQSKTWSKKLMNKSIEERREIGLKSAKSRLSDPNAGKLISIGKQKNKKIDWENKQTKPVIQETKDGKFIKLWASAYQAQKEAGYRSCNISGVCYKKYGQKFHRGFNWRFAKPHEI